MQFVATLPAKCQQKVAVKFGKQDQYDLRNYQLCQVNVSWKLLEIISADLLDTLHCRGQGSVAVNAGAGTTEQPLTFDAISCKSCGCLMT